MTLSAKTCFFVIVTALAASAQTAYAGGRMGGGGGGNFSRPAVRPPATVNRSLPVRSPGNVQTLNPMKGGQNGVASGVIRSSQAGNGNATGTNLHSDKIKTLSASPTTAGSTTPIITADTDIQKAHLGDYPAVSATNPEPRRDQENGQRSKQGPPVF